MDKHTTGPWLLKDDGTIRSQDFKGSNMMGDYRGVIVCDLKPSIGCDDFQNISRKHAIPEMRANARLIAAAPELLEALQSLVGVSPFGSETTLWRERESVVIRARAVIAKATSAQQGGASPRLLKALEALDPMFDNDSPLLKVYAAEIAEARAAVAEATPAATRESV